MHMMGSLRGLTCAESGKVNGDFIDSIEPTHFVTLVTNWDSLPFRKLSTHRSLSPEQKLRKITAALDKWGALVDRDLLGDRWLKKRDRRTRAFGVVEHLETNIHFHCAIRFAAGICPDKFETAAMKRWVQLVRTGHTEIVPFKKKCHLEWSISKEGRKLDFGTFGLIGPR